MPHVQTYKTHQTLTSPPRLAPRRAVCSATSYSVHPLLFHLSTRIFPTLCLRMTLQGSDTSLAEMKWPFKGRWTIWWQHEKNKLRHDKRDDSRQEKIQLYAWTAHPSSLRLAQQMFFQISNILTGTSLAPQSLKSMGFSKKYVFQITRSIFLIYCLLFYSLWGL